MRGEKRKPEIRASKLTSVPEALITPSQLEAVQKEIRERAKAFEDAKDFENALLCYEALLSTDGNDVEILRKKAALSKEMGDLEKAIYCYDRILETNGTDRDAWLNKAECLKLLGMYEKALLCHENFSSLFPDEDYELKMAKVLLKLKKLWEAELCSNKGLDKKSHHRATLLALGDVLCSMGMVDEAYQCYIGVAELEPTKPEVWCKIANLMVKSNKLDAAALFYDFGIALSGECLDAWLGKGDVLLEKKMFKEAAECYDRVMTFDPNNVRARRGKERADNAIRLSP